MKSSKTNVSHSNGTEFVGKDTLETIPDVFIIESLSRDYNGDVQGRSLEAMLKGLGQYPRYCDVSSKFELFHALEAFKNSGYRYLHISCHGNIVDDAIVMRNNENVHWKELVAKIADLKLAQTRLFLSACSCGSTRSLATKLFSTEGNKSVASVLAPDKDIHLDDALLFWATFYGRICCGPKKMTSRIICDAVVRSQYVCGYKESFSLYYHDPIHKTIKHYTLRPEGELTYSDPVEWPIEV